ncbi:prolactin-3B1-like [Nannospalax galili]|uniref:prolactin-3B1-like n=1 Tax=Nannospalax galili TaxID=1026970 RepID=UPI0004ED419F|nr:prolactin-3B1-like [Nannospalax galili]
MQLSLTQACSSGSLLLLLVSNMLLWENVVTLPQVQLSTKDLYDRLVVQSHDSHDLALQLYSEFTQKFMKMSWLREREPVPCHTASIPTPDSREQVHNTTTEDILNVTISTLHAWKDALKNLVPAMAILKGASDAMLSRVKGVQRKIEILLEGMKAILRKEYPGTEEGAYPAWTGQADLKSPNEDTRHFALFNVIRCLSRDTHRADNYLKVLRCREIFNNKC